MGALDALVGVSASLHGTFGRSVTIRRNATGAYDPATLTASSTPTDESVKAVFSQYRANELVGPIEAGDLRCTVYTATEPSVDDEIVDGSTVYKIVRVSSQYATDQVAYYELQVRR